MEGFEWEENRDRGERIKMNGEGRSGIVLNAYY